MERGLATLGARLEPWSQSWAKPLGEVCPAPCTAASQDQLYDRERLDSSLIKHQQERGASADTRPLERAFTPVGGEVTFTVVGGPSPRFSASSHRSSEVME